MSSQTPPMYVAFMRSSDKKYLRVDMSDGPEQYYLKFTKTVLSDEEVQHQIIPVVDDKYHNTVRIKCKANGMFWKRTDPDSWVLASGSPDSNCENDHNTLFEKVKLKDSGVALNNLKNQNFCKSHFLDDEKEYLIASTPDITDDAKLQIVHISPEDAATTST